MGYSLRVQGEGGKGNTTRPMSDEKSVTKNLAEQLLASYQIIQRKNQIFVGQ